MDWKFVLALGFALIVAVFAIQNAGAVDINFLLMDLSISQALVIIISAIFGALTVLMLGIIRWVRFSSKVRSTSKTVEALESENKLLKQKLDELLVKDETVESIETIEGV